MVVKHIIKVIGRSITVSKIQIINLASEKMVEKDLVTISGIYGDIALITEDLQTVKTSNVSVVVVAYFSVTID